MHHRRHSPCVARGRRRTLLALLLAVGAMLVTAPAFAGTYMDRAALLISQGDQEMHYLKKRLSDHELAHVIHEMASARLDAASTMEVPKAVRLAHPHVLLVLENYERAANYAAEGDRARFFSYLAKGKKEEIIMRGVFKELGWPLPKVK